MKNDNSKLKDNKHFNFEFPFYIFSFQFLIF